MKEIKLSFFKFLSKHWRELLVLIFIVIFLFYLRQTSIINNLDLNSNYQTTVAEIVDCYPSRSGSQFVMDYFVNKRRYQFIYHIRYCGSCFKDKACIGKKFIIRYSPLDPNNCELISEEPIE